MSTLTVVNSFVRGHLIKKSHGLCHKRWSFQYSNIVSKGFMSVSVQSDIRRYSSSSSSSLSSSKLNKMSKIEKTDSEATLLSQPWYTSEKVQRSIPERPNSFLESVSESTKIVLLSRDEKDRMTVYHNRNEKNGSVKPVYFTWEEVQGLMGNSDNKEYVVDEEAIMWIGSDGQSDYWALDSKNTEIREEVVNLNSELNRNIHADWSVTDWPLREFGDMLECTDDAAILASSYGLAQFHTMHPFCNLCGSKTKMIRVGAARSCTNCQTRIYPRINVATIFLITHGDYALLGRKAFWPKGRYSTLAGFLDVGETLEQCIVRETLEESGVHVDISSVTFDSSQPWPFPNSFMIGFRAEALHNKNDPTLLPSIQVDECEMEDVKWFHKDYVAARLQGGSTALEEYQSLSEAEQEFHIPGKASLARILITKWALEKTKI